MTKPVLLVMAAGVGSRYGGLKQIDPVGNHGQLLLDYAVYDAKRAGFETVVFVISPAMEAEFRAAIGDRIGSHMDLRYAFQDPDRLPGGHIRPEGREKPWGTAQAVLSARELIHSPFAVINADDYYGPAAFNDIFRFLTAEASRPERFALVGYDLNKTLSPHGHVARGVCQVDERHTLRGITELTHIEPDGDAIRYTQDGGETWGVLHGETIVSMNLWGLTPYLFNPLEEAFRAFLDHTLATGSLTAECLLPTVINGMVEKKLAEVTVLRSREQWYGVTYRADRDAVVAAIGEKTASGLYPDRLWEDS